MDLRDIQRLIGAEIESNGNYGIIIETSLQAFRVKWDSQQIESEYDLDVLKHFNFVTCKTPEQERERINRHIDRFAPVEPIEVSLARRYQKYDFTKYLDKIRR